MEKLENERDKEKSVQKRIRDVATKSHAAVQGEKSTKLLDSNYSKYLALIVVLLTIIFFPTQCSSPTLAQKDIDRLSAKLKQEIEIQGIPITDEQLANLARRLNSSIRNSDEDSSKYAEKLKEGRFSEAAEIQTRIAESHISLSEVLNKESALSFMDAGILYLPTDQIKARNSFLSALKADPALMDACNYVATLDFSINGNMNDAIESLDRCEPESKDDKERIERTRQHYKAMQQGDIQFTGAGNGLLADLLGDFGEFYSKELLNDCYNEDDRREITEDVVAKMYTDLNQSLFGNSIIAAKMLYTAVPTLSLCARQNEAATIVNYLEDLPLKYPDDADIFVKTAYFNFLLSRSNAYHYVGNADAAQHGLNELTELWNSDISKYQASIGKNLRFLDLMNLIIRIVGGEKNDMLLGKYESFLSVTDPNSSLFSKSFYQVNSLLATLSDYMLSQWGYFSQEQKKALVTRNYELVRVFAESSPDKELGRYNETMSLDRLLSWFSDVGEYDIVEQIILDIESIYNSRTVFDRAHGLNKDFYYLRLEANKLGLSKSRGHDKLTDKYLALHDDYRKKIPSNLHDLKLQDWDRLENLILSNAVNVALAEGRLNDIDRVDDRLLELHLQWSEKNKPYQDYMSSLENLLMTHVRKAERLKMNGAREKAREHLETVFQSVDINDGAQHNKDLYRTKLLATEGILLLYKTTPQRPEILETCKNWLLDQNALNFFLEEDVTALETYYDTMFLASEVFSDEVYLDLIVPSLDIRLAKVKRDLSLESNMKDYLILSRRLGLAYFQHNNFQKSEKYFSKCYISGKNSKNVDKDTLFESAYCAGFLGEIESNQNENITARQYLNYSINTFTKLASDSEIIGAQQNLEYFENLLVSLGQ